MAHDMTTHQRLLGGHVCLSVSVRYKGLYLYTRPAFTATFVLTVKMTDCSASLKTGDAQQDRCGT